MIAVLLLLGAAFLGIALVRVVLRTSLSGAEQVLWGIVIGWTLMTVLGYGAARLGGSLGSTTVFVVTLLTWSAALAAWLTCVRGGVRKGWPGWDRSLTPLLVLLLLSTPVYVHLFATHMLPDGPDGGIYSGGESSYYDLAYHAAVTTSFVHGSNFPPLYTPFPPAPLLYPFLPDFLTALLMTAGMSLHTALVATAVPLCLALTGIFYFFASRLLQLQQGQSRSPQAWTAAIATLLFFLNGGLGFIYFFQSGRLDVNYTHLPEKALVWPNVITDMLLPQRPSMFGLGIGLIVLSCFAMAWTGKKTDGRWAGWQHLLAAGVLAGFLPFFHVHSYVAVVFISGILFLLRPRRVWLLFWLPALVIALPRLFEFYHLATSGFWRWQPGWRGQDQPSWLLFWLRNVGLPALLIIPAWITVSRHLRLFYVSFVGLLALALLLVISPNDYDNLKLMTYWYAATSVLVADWLGRMGRRRFGWMFSIPLIAVSIFSGTLAVVAESQSSRLMFSRDEVAAAAFVRANTDPHSLFLTAPALHQPILSLAGRKVVRGPTAWLWSHGYPFAEREADVRRIYAGRDDALELLRYYRPDYIYLGRHEGELKANRQFFETTFPSIYRQADITIYDARKLRNDERTGLSEYPPREFASRIDRDPSEVLKEFQSIAYELYRLRKVALGSTPGFGEFADDLRQLGRGLYLGTPGWRKTLEDNEQLLCQQLLGRYEGKSDAECLAAFYANAGLQPSSGDMTVLLQELAAGRETRATILRRIAGDRSLFRRDYNTAYVLCHYFAYLKRDPDKAPDHDLTGINFWRQQLDRTHDYRGLTRAFMESDEYKAQ